MPYSTWRDGSRGKWQQVQSSTWVPFGAGDLSAQVMQSPGLAWKATPTRTSEHSSSAQCVFSVVLSFKKVTWDNFRKEEGLSYGELFLGLAIRDTPGAPLAGQERR